MSPSKCKKRYQDILSKLYFSSLYKIIIYIFRGKEIYSTTKFVKLFIRGGADFYKNIYFKKMSKKIF